MPSGGEKTSGTARETARMIPRGLSSAFATARDACARAPWVDRGVRARASQHYEGAGFSALAGSCSLFPSGRIRGALNRALGR